MIRQNDSDLLANSAQVRGAAWSLREVEDAAWAAPDGSAEKAYFRSAADANWKWLVSKIPDWTAHAGRGAWLGAGRLREPRRAAALAAGLLRLHRHPGGARAATPMR